MKLHDVIEAFNTKLPLQWQTQGNFELTSFNIGDFTYIIQIEKKPLNYPGLESLEGKKAAEVSFFLQEPTKGYSEFDTLNIFKQNALKIFGIVYNALVDKFEEYDAFMFTAKTRHSSSPEEYKTKKRIYDNLADRIAKSHGLFKYTQPLGDGQGFLVSKHEIDLNEGWRNPVLEWVQKQNFSNSPGITVN